MLGAILATIEPSALLAGTLTGVTLRNLVASRRDLAERRLTMAGPVKTALIGAQLAAAVHSAAEAPKPLEVQYAENQKVQMQGKPQGSR